MNHIFNKALGYVAAAASVAAAVAVIIVALAYAEFAFASEHLSNAASAAIVAGTVALCLAIVAGVMVARTDRKKPAPEPSIGEKTAEFIKRRPIVAVAAALGGGFLALRNPALVATMVMSFLAPAPPKKR